MKRAIWWWLSFATKERHLGIALVKATSFLAAVYEAHRSHCNPGGEVAGWPFPRSFAVPERWAGRVLTRDEADAASREMTGTPVVSTLDHDNIIEPSVAPEADNEGS